MIGFVLYFGLGIMGLLWALVLDSFVTFFVNAFYSKRLIGYSMGEQLNDIKGIFMIAVVMAAVTYSLNFILPVHDLFMIIIQITVGVVLYILLSYIFKVEELRTIYEIIQPIQKKLFIKYKVNKSHIN